MAPHRDPETGKFTSSQTFEDIEVVTGAEIVGIDSLATDGDFGDDFPESATFEGLQLIDYDEIVDRNEALHLLEAHHHLDVYLREDTSPSGTYMMRAHAEVSASPARQVAIDAANAGDVEADTTGLEVSEFGSTFDDSIDLIGRALSAAATGGPIQGTFDADSGGGQSSGTPGSDTVDLDSLPAPIAEFHPRDELFLNGVLESSNADVAMYMELNYQHLYGVVEG